MDYYYLKINAHEQTIKDWFEGRNQLEKPAAVIFFGMTHVDDLLQQQDIHQAPGFCKAGLKQNRPHILIINVSSGYLWIVHPISKVEEIRDDGHDIWKVMRVNVLFKKRLNEIPPTLASITSNQFLIKGTFRKITDLGSIKAIEMVTKKCLSPVHHDETNLTPKNLFECLSSVELETLIARIFEAEGCFVPAYRGGYMKDIDIFAKNLGDDDMNFEGVTIRGKSTISIQVKSRIKSNYTPIADYLITLGVNQAGNVLNEVWIANMVRRYRGVQDWLKLSLDWLPPEYLDRYREILGR